MRVVPHGGDHRNALALHGHRPARLAQLAAVLDPRKRDERQDDDLGHDRDAPAHPVEEDGVPVERARQRVRVAEARLAGLEDLDEHEQEDELRHREDAGQPRRLPADHPLVDEDIERDAHHQVHPDRHDPALVAEQDREERGEQHGPDEGDHPRLDPADDRGAHQATWAVLRVRRIARAVSEASES